MHYQKFSCFKSCKDQITFFRINLSFIAGLYQHYAASSQLALNETYMYECLNFDQDSIFPSRSFYLSVVAMNYQILLFAFSI